VPVGGDVQIGACLRYTVHRTPSWGTLGPQQTPSKIAKSGR